MERRQFLQIMAGAALTGYDAINRPYALFMPQASKELSPTSERTWNTFATDLSKLKSDIDISLPSTAISVEGLNAFGDTNKEKLRKLQLKTGERTIDAYKNIVAEDTFAPGEVQSIFLNPLADLTLTQNPNFNDGAGTKVIHDSQTHVISEFGVLINEQLINIGNESFHQEIDNEIIVAKHPGYQKFIIEALSNMAEWDLIRYSRIGSPDLYVELPLDVLRENLRNLRTDYSLPFEKTEAYDDLLRAFGVLINLTLAPDGTRDHALVSFSESVGATLAKDTIYENPSKLKEDAFSFLAEEKTGKSKTSTIGAAIRQILPPDQENTMLPIGITQVLALDHYLPPTEQKGLNGEPGLFIRGMSFLVDETSVSTVPVGRIVKAATNNGITVDFSKAYEVGIQGTNHTNLFIPLAALSQPEIPNGTIFSLTVQVQDLLKYHNLTWNFEGTSPTATTAPTGEKIEELLGIDQALPYKQRKETPILLDPSTITHVSYLLNK